MIHLSLYVHSLMELGCVLTEHVCETKHSPVRKKRVEFQKNKKSHWQMRKTLRRAVTSNEPCNGIQPQVRAGVLFHEQARCVLLLWCTSAADAHTGNLLLGARRCVPALWAAEGHCGKSNAANEIRMKTNPDTSALLLREILSTPDES